MVNRRSLHFSACPAVSEILAGWVDGVMHAHAWRESCLSPPVSSFPLFGKEWPGLFSHEDVVCLQEGRAVTGRTLVLR